MADPQSVEESLMLARQHEATARLVAEDKLAAGQALFHAGLGVECALKAYIMWRERLNGWPSKDARKELYTHDLRELAEIAGIRKAPDDPVAPALHIMLQWDRNQGYDPKPMPRKVARSYVEAAFGERGVVTWLRSSLIRNI